ncbi:hypothetical protein JHK87_044773 [Glycine soja]|nr:hypothetical protein JHK87_044773 [Glycine soja]
MNKQVPKNCSRHGSDKYVKFDVHINDDEDNLSEPDQTEFVGTFVNLFHGQGHNIKVTSFKVGISKVLDCLEAEEDDVVLVTLVPKVGKGDVIIGGIKVEFIPKVWMVNGKKNLLNSALRIKFGPKSYPRPVILPYDNRNKTNG